MSRLSQSEYLALKPFLRAWYDRSPFSEMLTPDVHPSAVLEEIEAASPARARSGLAMAINDIMESAVDLSVEEVSAIDADFRERGIVTLSELRLRYGRHYRAIAKRGRIRNEEDYYLIAGIVASPVEGLSEVELASLSSMIASFEETVTKKQKKTAEPGATDNPDDAQRI